MFDLYLLIFLMSVISYFLQILLPFPVWENIKTPIFHGVLTNMVFFIYI